MAASKREACSPKERREMEREGEGREKDEEKHLGGFGSSLVPNASAYHKAKFTLGNVIRFAEY